MPKADPFPARLRKLRESRGLSQRQLGRQAGLSSAALSYLEAGEREPTVATLRALAAALGVPLAELLPG